LNQALFVNVVMGLAKFKFCKLALRNIAFGKFGETIHYKLD